MSSVEINVWGLILGAVASLVIGSIYYADGVYGKAWKKLGKIDEKRYKKEFNMQLPVLLIGALVTSWVVGLLDSFYQKFYAATWMRSGLAAGLIVFVAVAASLTVHSVLDQRPRKLLYLTLGNRFLTLLAMGLIYGALHP